VERRPDRAVVWARLIVSDELPGRSAAWLPVGRAVPGL